MPVVPVEHLPQYIHLSGVPPERIVLTNGHFDLLHVGHLRYLQQARELGDLLIVGVNDDRVTADRKGPGRPVLPEEERAELVAGLECVDLVAIFHEPTAEELVRLVRPGIYVKGGDYGPGGAELPERAAVEELGGEVHILPFVGGRSTSEIIEAIRSGRGVR